MSVPSSDFLYDYLLSDSIYRSREKLFYFFSKLNFFSSSINFAIPSRHYFLCPSLSLSLSISLFQFLSLSIPLSLSFSLSLSLSLPLFTSPRSYFTSFFLFLTQLSVYLSTYIFTDKEVHCTFRCVVVFSG